MRMTGTALDSLKAKKSVLLVIDPQEKLHPKVFEPDRVTKNCILLIKSARLAEIPMLVTTQYEKGLGGIIEPIKAELTGIDPIDKVEFGCFNNENFLKRMDMFGISRNSLILCGIESHICVTQTALGALERGYLVHIASDATSSRTAWNWNTGLGRRSTGLRDV